jgi:hypothetical protein
MKPKSDKKAVLASITAAVTNYIRTQEVRTQESSLLPAERVAIAVSAALTAGNCYGAYGRQQTMEKRRLLSMRLMRH